MVEESFRIKTFSDDEIEKAKKRIAEAKRIKREEADLRNRGTNSKSSSRLTDEEQEIRGDSKLDLRDQKNKRTAAKKAAIQKKKTEKLISQKQKAFENKVFGKLDSVKSFATGGTSGAVVSILGKFGPIGLIIASALTPIIALVAKEFERGGFFSTKLKVTKDTLTVNDIEDLELVSSGTKYLTGDLSVVQGAPNSSNTQNLKYEHIRYVMEDVGRP